MCVLADGDIRLAIETGVLQVEPFNDQNLTPNGLDLTIGEVYIKSSDTTIRDGVAVIPPGTWFALATAEILTLGPRTAGQLWIRSTWARRGVVVGFGKVEAGFSGTLTIGCAHLGPEPLELPMGDRFCQIVFETLLSHPEALYAERSGNYQGQRGVTLTPTRGADIA